MCAHICMFEVSICYVYDVYVEKRKDDTLIIKTNIYSQQAKNYPAELNIF